MPYGIRLLVSGDHACFTRPGNEGRARLLRRDDAVRRARHPRSDPLEAGDPLDRRRDPRAEADPLSVHPAQ